MKTSKAIKIDLVRKNSSERADLLDQLHGCIFPSSHQLPTSITKPIQMQDMVLKLAGATKTIESIQHVYRRFCENDNLEAIGESWVSDAISDLRIDLEKLFMESEQKEEPWKADYRDIIKKYAEAMCFFLYGLISLILRQFSQNQKLHV